MIVGIQIAVDGKPFTCKVEFNDEFVKSGLFNAGRAMVDIDNHIDRLVDAVTDYMEQQVEAMGKKEGETE